jgi:hypothetical protein
VNYGIEITGDLIARIASVEMSQVDLDQAPARIHAMVLDVAFLDATVVERIEVVDYCDLFTIGEKRVNEVTPDESSAAGDQNVAH